MGEYVTTLFVWTKMIEQLPCPTVIGLDWDGTCTRDVVLWRSIVALMKAQGHTVYIVTMRYPSEVNDMRFPMDPTLISAVDKVFFTSRMAKGPFMEKQGIKVHVWIDDNPRAVHETAEQIWGNSSKEGQIVVPEVPESGPMPEQPIRLEK